MTTLNISSMPNKHVTRSELDEIKNYMDTGFDKTNDKIDFVEKKIDDLKGLTMEGFDKMEEYVDNSFTSFGKEMDIKFTKNRDEIIDQVKSMISTEVSPLKQSVAKIESQISPLVKTVAKIESEFAPLSKAIARIEAKL